MIKGKKIVLEEGIFPAVCSGCRLCETVCSFEHEEIFAPWLSRIKVVKVDHITDYPLTCKLCKNPPCKNACPQGVISKNKITDAIDINNELCIGCGECVLACPFGAISIPREKVSPIVCNLCDGDPKCVKYCPTEVLKLKDSEDVAKRKRFNASFSNNE